MKSSASVSSLCLCMALSWGCASSWPRAEELGSEDARAQARRRAKAALQNGRAHPADRETAAQLLGELGDPCAGCVSILGRVLLETSAPDALRARAAWSLGRLHDPESADPLIESLATDTGPLASSYILDALWSKEDLVFTAPEVQADLAEALNVFMARQGKQSPRTARSLQARVATLPVSVRVLDRAIGMWLHEASSLNEAALVRAIRTVLRRLDEGQELRRRSPDAAWIEVREAVYFLQRASVVGGPKLRRRVWATTGNRAGEALLAKAVAEAFFGTEVPVPGRPTHAPAASERFIGAWLGQRVLLARPSVRAALYEDLLLWESSPEVFRLLFDLAQARELDLVRELAP